MGCLKSASSEKSLFSFFFFFCRKASCWRRLRRYCFDGVYRENGPHTSETHRSRADPCSLGGRAQREGLDVLDVLYYTRAKKPWGRLWRLAPTELLRRPTHCDSSFRPQPLKPLLSLLFKLPNETYVQICVFPPKSEIETGSRDHPQITISSLREKKALMESSF